MRSKNCEKVRGLDFCRRIGDEFLKALWEAVEYGGFDEKLELGKFGGKTGGNCATSEIPRMKGVFDLNLSFRKPMSF